MQVVTAILDDVLTIDLATSSDSHSNHGLVDYKDFNVLDIRVHVIKGTIHNMSATLTQFI